MKVWYKLTVPLSNDATETNTYVPNRHELLEGLQQVWNKDGVPVSEQVAGRFKIGLRSGESR